MKVDFVPEVKTTMTQSGRPALFVVELSRTETMRLIAQLAANLVPSIINRYGVIADPKVINIPMFSFLNDKVKLGDASISVNINEGYLSGDTIREE